MKIIFLDIDGVLNTFKTTSDLVTVMGVHFCKLDWDCVRQLNKITDAVPEAEIVISSTWRHGNEHKWNALLHHFKNQGVKKEPIDRTPSCDGQRGDECLLWLARNSNKGIDNFIAIDDDSDFDCMWRRLVLVREGMKGGLKARHATEAIQMLRQDWFAEQVAGYIEKGRTM